MGLLDLFFFPNTGSVVVRSSQGRFFVLFDVSWLQKCHIWSKNMIYGPDFLKNDDIWSDIWHMVLMVYVPLDP